jgi:beta-ketoacyl-acyl-carrier-protein synthase II
MGMITCLGLSLQSTWDGLINGRSGIKTVEGFDVSALPVHIAGQVRGFDPTMIAHLIEPKEARRMARGSQFSMAAAYEALSDAKLEIGKDVKAERTGVVMGTAIGGFDLSYDALHSYDHLGYKRVNPFGLPQSLPNMPSHHVSKFFNAKGPLSTVVAACASGTQAIGDAMEMIRRGRTDVVFAGGYESVRIDGALVGFSLMRVLASKYNHTPEKACRPFDINRDGFAFAEGAAVVIVEDYEHAKARGATIYAEVLGLGVSSDAHHIAIPDPTGSGAVRAMEWALEDAQISPNDIDYINTHGSGTQTNDPLETRAIKQLFCERAYDIPINSIKSMTGHAMGAAGAIEAISTVMTIKHGIIPPTINLDNPDPECDLDYVPNVARRQEVNIGISNSFGLGGQNASIILGKI